LGTNLTVKEQIARKCKHFNGVFNKICKVGVEYNSVKGEKPMELPCINTGGECSKAEFRTEEEVDALVASLSSLSGKALTNYAKIKADYEKNKMYAGKVDCECGGVVSYSVAQSNGHIWAKCNNCGMSFNE